MQPDDLEIELPSPCLNIDAALQRLGMLASTTNSRHEYLRELQHRPQQRKHQPGYLQINTRYVSNVSIGFRLRPLTPHVRYKPYQLRENKRHRTRSENNDQDAPAPVLSSSLSKVTAGPSVALKVDEMTELPDLAQLKKAKSLESIVGESDDLKSIQIPCCPELEVVSNSIQNLKVVE